MLKKMSKYKAVVKDDFGREKIQMNRKEKKIYIVDSPVVQFSELNSQINPHI